MRLNIGTKMVLAFLVATLCSQAGTEHYSQGSRRERQGC